MRSAQRRASFAQLAVDGAAVVLKPGGAMLDLAEIFPGEAKKGRDGSRVAGIAFALDVAETGIYRVFRHNDYHGALSVNGSPFEPLDGPFSG